MSELSKLLDELQTLDPELATALREDLRDTITKTETLENMLRSLVRNRLVDKYGTPRALRGLTPYRASKLAQERMPAAAHIWTPQLMYALARAGAWGAHKDENLPGRTVLDEEKFNAWLDALADGQFPEWPFES